MMVESSVAITIISGCAFITSVVCFNMRRSRCTKITTPCCTLERTLLDIKEDTLDIPIFK